MFDACIYFNLNTTSRLVNQLWEDAFKPVGLSPSHAYLLMAINAQPGSTQTELKDIMRVKPSTLTRFIDQLEKKGLAIRQVKGKESRIFPTDKGEELSGKLGDIAGEVTAKLYSLLSPELAKDLLNNLQKAAEKKLD